MKEKIKTAVLVVLIVMSLVQSYFLAFSQPEFDLINHHDYVEVEWVGPQKTLQSLMRPEEIIVYNGPENKYTVFHPYFQFYDLIVHSLKERTFGGFRELTDEALSVERLKENRSWLELRFSQPLSAEVLSDMMAVRSDAFTFNDEINRILLASNGEEEVHTYFITESAVYEAINSDLTRRHFDQYIGYGEQMPSYVPLWFDQHYVPLEPITAKQVTLRYETFTAEQLQTSLFADPSAVRRLLEQNRTEIFTDGKRGLEVDRARNWMSFYDPSAPVEARPQDRMAGLNKALQFVNRHGGWHGEFLLGDVVTHPYGAAETYVFRQYYAALPNDAALPIMTSKEGRFGHLEVTVQQGMITNYERSLIALQKQPEKITEVELPGAEQLQKLLEKVSDGGTIEDIFLAYYPVIENGTIELIPRWTAKIGESDYIFLHE